MSTSWAVWVWMLAVFVAGGWFYAHHGGQEGFCASSSTLSIDQRRCPDLLVQKGTRFFLYNSKVREVPGVNPIVFQSLEDYTAFLEWQRSQGIRCPVLYLQASYDAQGQRVYKPRPSVSDPQAGLPPAYDNLKPSPLAPSGIASQGPAAFESESDPQYVSPLTKLLLDHRRPRAARSAMGADVDLAPEGTSVDPMDPNWGGADYTQAAVDAGEFAGDSVSMYVGDS